MTPGNRYFLKIEWCQILQNYLVLKDEEECAFVR